MYANSMEAVNNMEVRYNLVEMLELELMCMFIGFQIV